jgi:hypothetical protein
LWKYTIGPTHRGHDGSEDGIIGSPVIGRGKVFVVGPRGKLFALGLDDGELKWSVDLITELGAEPPLYGFAMTPLLEGDMLIVQVGAVEGRALCGLNPDSGELVWSVGDGFQDPERCQSPIVMSLGGHRQVVAMNGQEILGVAPTDGTILWRHSLWEDANASSGFVCPMGDDRFYAIFDGQVSGFRVSHQDSDWTSMVGCRRFACLGRTRIGVSRCSSVRASWVGRGPRPCTSQVTSTVSIATSSAASTPRAASVCGGRDLPGARG